MLDSLRSLLTLPPGSDPGIARHFRRNFFANGLDMVSWLLGVSFMSISAIMPVYVRHLTESPLIFGLIPALTDFGWFAPLIGRLVAQSIGYPALFATSLFFAAGGSYLLSRRVKELRHLEKI